MIVTDRPWMIAPPRSPLVARTSAPAAIPATTIRPIATPAVPDRAGRRRGEVEEREPAGVRAVEAVDHGDRDQGEDGDARRDEEDPRVGRRRRCTAPGRRRTRARRGPACSAVRIAMNITRRRRSRARPRPDPAPVVQDADQRDRDEDEGDRPEDRPPARRPRGPGSSVRGSALALAALAASPLPPRSRVIRAPAAR